MRITLQKYWGLLFFALLILGPAFVPLTAQAADDGESVFKKKRCNLCHQISGKGGRVGPDLSQVGSDRDEDWIRKFLEDPKGVIPGAKMMPVKANEVEMDALVKYLLSLNEKK